jgi:uncharacterized protein
MNKKSFLRYTALCLLSLYVSPVCKAQRSAAFQKLKSVPETYQLLPVGTVKPKGWLRQQIADNLAGFVGNLDRLVPALVVRDDIYGKDRLSRKVKSKDVGAISDGGEWEVQFLWWNSETQSNWWDGYIRSAILAGDKEHLARIEQYVQRILSTQDADGYLGIYDKELRYTFDKENGELWAKAALLRGLLAWYEYKKDPRVFSAIERAVQNVMDHYPINASRPFYSVNPYVGGLSHGLTFTDVLDNLYRLTGKVKYRDYALFLYKDFSIQKLNEDAQLAKLLDTTILFQSHGVHTYEHLRSLTAAYYASGNPGLKKALDNFLNRLPQYTTPSGAPVGDEWIGGRKADATHRGYEYCSLHELMHGYVDQLVRSGKGSFGDKAELLFFNAAQGARHPHHSAIAYLKSDNSFYMMGGLNGDTSNKKQTRFKYSPVHQDAAVCCVPNAGRIAPYYVQHMWMKDAHGLVAALLGPSEVTTTLKGQPVTITEDTYYPFRNSVTFKISVKQPTAFALRIRKPSWTKAVQLNHPYIVQGDYLVINKTWRNGDVVTLDLATDVAIKQDDKGDHYYTYGSLVFALPIASKETITRSHPLPGFHDYHYEPVSLEPRSFAPEARPEIVLNDANMDADIQNSIALKTELTNKVKGNKEEVTLIPIGATILRQVTFIPKP